MRVSDAIREAGGLRPEAYAEGAEFFRNPSLLATAGQRDLAGIISRLNDLLNQSTFQREQAKSDLERIKAAGAATRQGGDGGGPLAALTGEGGGPDAPANNPAATAAIASQLSRRDLVSPPRALTDADLAPDGNIAVNVADALKRPGGDDDLVLVDGDSITIPERPSTVQVIGAVFNARSVPFKAGGRIDQYVAQCGGFTPDAAPDRIIVIQAGGGLTPASTVRAALKPGDVIVVPTRVLAEKLATRSNGLDGLFKSITNSAIVFRLAGSLFGL
jgi:protein involved in polysaccharide export with SLBB domain